MNITAHRKHSARIAVLHIAATAMVLLSIIGCRGPAAANNDSASERLSLLIKNIHSVPGVMSIEAWPLPSCLADQSTPGLTIKTKHYQIHTTHDDPLILRQVPITLESAYAYYCHTIGQSVKPKNKLQIYFFKTRSQWEDFTRYWAKHEAKMYLQITSGAYYLNGLCVVYHIGRYANFSVLVHEGWHQFADQLFEFRLPAWLDEGLATNCEAYNYRNGKVEFSPDYNGSRLYALKQALTKNTMLPLTELLRNDPGSVLSYNQTLSDTSEQDAKIATYYAQIYAFVRFLREYNYGRYLEGFQKMLRDGRLGRWSLKGRLLAEARQHNTNPSRRWNSTVGPLLLRTYIGPPARLQKSYIAFCKQIVAKARLKKRGAQATQ